MSEYTGILKEEDRDITYMEALEIDFKNLANDLGNAMIRIDDRDKKIKRQRAQIRRLEEGAKSRKNLIKKLHRKITELEKEIVRLNKLQYDH